jgi:hypothetical protein
MRFPIFLFIVGCEISLISVRDDAQTPDGVSTFLESVGEREDLPHQ